jgi:hypothetical protein
MIRVGFFPKANDLAGIVAKPSHYWACGVREVAVRII